MNWIKEKPKDYSEALYFGIPCYYNLVTANIIGRNRFYNWLLGIATWIDVNVLLTKEFKVKVRREMNWISVEDRLPEIGKRVLLYQDHNYFELGERYDPNDWDLEGENHVFFTDEIMRVRSVTHWCEITEPSE